MGEWGGCFVSGTSTYWRWGGNSEASPKEGAKTAVGGDGIERMQSEWEAEQAKAKREDRKPRPMFVPSRNAETGETSWRRVSDVYKRHVSEVLYVSLKDARTGQVVERIGVTVEHPFMTTKGWVEAGRLGIGTSIVTRAGPRLVVCKVEHERRAGGYDVFNATVDTDHTYFVGSTLGGAWVHNNSIANSTGNSPYPGNPDNIRRDNFPVRPRASAVQRANRNTPVNSNGQFLCLHCGEPITGKPSPEHHPPVSTLWNESGYNMTQPERFDIWNENVVGWAHLQCQRIQGGRMRSTHQFIEEIGPNYVRRPPG